MARRYDAKLTKIHDDMNNVYNDIEFRMYETYCLEVAEYDCLKEYERELGELIDRYLK